MSSRRGVWSIKKPASGLRRRRDRRDWAQLDMFLDQFCRATRRSARRREFGATLEMAREGLIELRQDEPFSRFTCANVSRGGWEKIG